MDLADANQLRRRHYNATITMFRRVHDDLAILRVRPDDGPLTFEPGQYTVLGLGQWEPRIDHTQSELIDVSHESRLIRRAYSISSRLLDEQGRIVRATDSPDVDFYVALVRQSAGHSPALTPRLFLLDQGDRLHLGMRAHGRYTLDGVRPNDDVVFCATGTGEAPHNAMIAELLSRGHQGRIASLVSVRYYHDLAYIEMYRTLERTYRNFCYLPLTTREPENIDPNLPNFQGKRYIQDFFVSEDFQTHVGFHITPETTHVYLCGNPAMVGLTQQSAVTNATISRQSSMVEALKNLGFRLDHPNVPGNIHVEQYW